MDSNAITIRDVINSYEELKLSTELRLDKSKFHNGLVKIFANHGEKINFKSSDYKNNWPKLKKCYQRTVEKWNDDKKQRLPNTDPFRNFENLDDIFYSTILYPNLCFREPSQ